MHKQVINRDEGAHQLVRVYDPVLATDGGAGRQSWPDMRREHFENVRRSGRNCQWFVIFCVVKDKFFGITSRTWFPPHIAVVYWTNLLWRIRQARCAMQMMINLQHDNIWSSQDVRQHVWPWPLPRTCTLLISILTEQGTLMSKTHEALEWAIWLVIAAAAGGCQLDRSQNAQRAQAWWYASHIC